MLQETKTKGSDQDITSQEAMNISMYVRAPVLTRRPGGQQNYCFGGSPTHEPMSCHGDMHQDVEVKESR